MKTRKMTITADDEKIRLDGDGLTLSEILTVAEVMVTEKFSTLVPSDLAREYARACRQSFDIAVTRSAAEIVRDYSSALGESAAAARLRTIVQGE